MMALLRDRRIRRDSILKSSHTEIVESSTIRRIRLPDGRLGESCGRLSACSCPAAGREPVAWWLRSARGLLMIGRQPPAHQVASVGFLWRGRLGFGALGRMPIRQALGAADRPGLWSRWCQDAAGSAVRLGFSETISACQYSSFWVCLAQQPCPEKAPVAMGAYELAKDRYAYIAQDRAGGVNEVRILLE